MNKETKELAKEIFIARVGGIDFRVKASSQEEVAKIIQEQKAEIALEVKRSYKLAEIFLKSDPATIPTPEPKKVVKQEPVKVAAKDDDDDMPPQHDFDTNDPDALGDF